eukprot:8038559-Alexandrium_andersonii.AAC.1
MAIHGEEGRQRAHEDPGSRGDPLRAPNGPLKARGPHPGRRTFAQGPAPCHPVQGRSQRRHAVQEGDPARSIGGED